MMHYKSTTLKAISTSKTEGTFWGYASTQDVDQAKDQILSGAFGDTLKIWKNIKKRHPYLHWEHESQEIIGYCQDIFEDTQGLFVKGSLFLEVPKAKKALKRLEEGIDGLSIGFYITKAFYEKGIRKIEKIDLQEISLAQYPCNPYAQIYSYKSFDVLKKNVWAEEDDLSVLRHIKNLSWFLKSY